MTALAVDEEGVLYLSLAKALKETKDALQRMFENKADANFAKARACIASKRRTLTELASRYYRSCDLQRVADNVPLLAPQGWIPEAPIDVRDIDRGLAWRSDGFDIARSSFARPKGLPGGRTMVENIGRTSPKTVLTNDFAYRLLEATSGGAAPRLTCGAAYYFDYVETCERLAFEFAEALVSRLENPRPEPVEVSRLSLPLRSRTRLEELGNRASVIGVNTLLIGLDPSETMFYLHERSAETVLEAVNTMHVVPAGTFQPAHPHNGLHTRDFSIYANILREFGEELLGREELAEAIRETHRIEDNEPLKSLHRLVVRGKARAFYLGTALDALTTKPEVLTVWIGSLKEMRKLRHFEDNMEGKHFPVEWHHAAEWQADSRTLPAGAGCLALARRHFNLLRKSVTSGA